MGVASREGFERASGEFGRHAIAVVQHVQNVLIVEHDGRRGSDGGMPQGVFQQVADRKTHQDMVAQTGNDSFGKGDEQSPR